MRNIAIFQKEAVTEIKKAITRLIEIREALNLSVYAVSKAADVFRTTIDRIEKSEATPTLEILFPLIHFYGFTLPNFFNFDKPLPSADKLKAQLIKFHKAHGSDAYINLFKDPKLIDLLDEELIPSGYFKKWRDVQEVQQHCRDTYGYNYASATGTLNTAVKKGWLVRDDKVKPKRYKKKG